MAPAISDIRRREEARIQTTFQAATTTVAIATASPSHTSPAQTTSPTTPTPIDASNGIGGTPGNIESPSSAGTTTVLIIVILCCASAIMSATLFYIFDRKKNAQFREACKRDPYLTRKEFARRRKLSALERLEEEELQRSIMIRKSLASRGPSRSNSCEDVFDLSSMQEQHHRRHHHHHHHHQMTDLDMPEPPRGRQQMREHREDLHHGRQLSGEWAPTQTSEPTEETYQAVVNKRKELRRRRKELRRRRKVFDEINNIYTAKPYKPKMLGPNGAATDENAEGFKDDLNCVVMCPDCKEYPPNLVEEFSSGDMVCGSCGLVVGDKIIDTRSEWRTFANDDQGNDDPSRVGDAVNPLLNGSQLETTIAFGDGRDSKQLARLQNKSQNDKASKSLMQAYKEIGAFCDSINLGKNVSDAAKHIFKLTYDHNFMKGKPQEAVIAGCIFIACRQTGVGRTFREIFQVTHVSKKEIGRVFKQLESFLQKIKEENPRGAGSLSNLDGYKASASTSAEDLCTRFCSNLNFRNAQKIENVSRALARKTSSVSELAGRSPLSVAAACIYMASHLMKESRTSKEIASVAGVSDGTIKTAYRFLYQARDRLIEKEWGADKKAIDNLPVN
ncbi:transcription factor TFIIB [Colletotrichum paranaense]|uniref:Transcription initiation factor IIB n=1 Tax=Colletotrichum paranaense TaxID=1914294 RepID=A0ABQ9SGN3_9PEZI|nr:transcription factor TFIIB [Colletotrichum paranaense]KAK1535867.1 transcription factor TFIIB [Colletotrichum paranaense]